VGGTNSEGERGALVPRGERGGEGEEISLPHPALPAVSSPSGVWGRASAENDFIVI